MAVKAVNIKPNRWTYHSHQPSS